MSEPRKHHYIPQCYLRNFSIDNRRKQVLLLDMKRKIKRVVSIADIAQRRDFNRVEIHDVDPNALEKSFSKFEDDVSRSIKIIVDGGDFTAEIKDNILNLIALLAVRSPQKRNGFAQSYAHVAKIIMDISLTSEKSWHAYMKKFPIDQRVSFEKAKDFFESDSYKIATRRETHIRDELKMFEVVLPLLYARKWQLIIGNSPTHLFFTSDNPVVINWNEPDKVPLIYKSSPGFGRIDTTIGFPLTSNHFLIGRFDIDNDGYVEATDDIVATCNTFTIESVYEQIFTSSFDAYITTDENLKFVIKDLF
jgi:hypothetical protein